MKALFCNCRNCEFWISESREINPIGECRRHAPTFTNSVSIDNFPKTNCQSFCGDWIGMMRKGDTKLSYFDVLPSIVKTVKADNSFA
jgi:hypothetical protein